MMANSLGRRMDSNAKMMLELLPKQIGRRFFIRGQHLLIGDFEDFCHIDLNKVVHRIFQSRQRHPVATDSDYAAVRVQHYTHFA